MNAYLTIYTSGQPDFFLRSLKRKMYLALVLLNPFQFCFSQTNTLDYYLRHTLANSPLLKDYQNQMESNNLDSMRIRAVYKPQVSGNSINSYAPVIGGFGYDPVISNGGQLSAVVAVNQAIVSKKNINSQFETLRLHNQGIDISSKISEQDLVRTITSQYITAYGSLQQLNFTKEINQLLEKEAEILKTLTEKNIYRQTDYLTFLVTMQQEQLAIKQLSIQYRNDFATLNYLSGIIDTATVTLEEPSIILHELPGIDNSVFFRKYTIDSLLLVNSRLLIDFSYKPKISLYADGGYNSSFAYQAYKNFGTSFGVNISVPIYDGKQKKILYNKLGLSEQTRLAYQDFYKKQYNQQVAQLMQQLKSTEELISDINNQIKYAEGLINVNAKLLETGDAKIPDLVIALNNYLAAKHLLTLNKVGRLQIINQINYWNR
jgi:outer membrane protein TolC